MGSSSGAGAKYEEIASMISIEYLRSSLSCSYDSLVKQLSKITGWFTIFMRTSLILKFIEMTCELSMSWTVLRIIKAASSDLLISPFSACGSKALQSKNRDRGSIKNAKPLLNFRSSGLSLEMNTRCPR
ncbi:hypothetical protein OGATHE_003279 [Ogataea polymorpha]|uniref:Uncharacterized protein n=1 Tax=Ogataea polymorpha TaxID=460523 RepID=A0A9P8P3P9_9ASCO|nr:hypothetical protein OGATHE_003279 [Ogataea polymorpha]